MPNFDLVELAIKGVCPNNTVIYDDKGYPSIMVEVPKFTYKDAGLGDSTDVLPCFKVNDQIVDSVFISKYQNIVHDNRAYSLPGVTQTSNVTFDQAIQYCANKGAGWHLMTNPEWGAIMRWCAIRGITPLGNNNCGRHASESVYTAIPADYESGKIRRIKVGTGPLSYYHDGTPSGIATGAVIMILAGIFPMFGALLATLPDAVLGGCTIMMFGTIVVSGLQMISKCGFSQRNTVIAALSLSIGLGFTQCQDLFAIFPDIIQTVFAQNCVAVVFVVAIVLNLILPANMEAVQE